LVKINEKVVSGLRVFESWVEFQMAYSGQPGISAAVIHDQEVVFERDKFGQVYRLKTGENYAEKIMSW
jgi:hypothetical protein